MRVYLPTTLTALSGTLKEGELGPVPLHGYAVTPALREAYASGDEEELEYVAMLGAARESVRLLAADPEVPRRRVVLAADVSDDDVTWIAYEGEPAAVSVCAAIPLGKVAAGHVDDVAAEADIAAAADASALADAGDEDAAFTVDGAEGHELGWYATQELTYLTERPLARGDDPFGVRPQCFPGGHPRTPDPPGAGRLCALSSRRLPSLVPRDSILGPDSAAARGLQIVTTLAPGKHPLNYAYG